MIDRPAHASTATWCLLLAMTLLAAPADAQDDLNADAELRRGLRLMGYETVLANLEWLLPIQLEAGFGAKAKGQSEPEQIFTSAYRPVELFERVIRELSPYPRRGLENLHKFASTPLAQKLLVAEQAALGQTEGSQIEAYEEQLVQQGVSPGRVDLAIEIDRATGRSNRNSILYAAPAGVLSLAFEGATRRPPSKEGLTDLVESIHTSRSRLVANLTKVEILYVLRDFTDAELTELRDAFSRPYFQALRERADLALGQALLLAEEHVTAGLFQWADRFAASNEAALARAQGTATGADHDDAGCLDSALELNTGCKAISCHLWTGVFLSACLDAAAKSGELCAGLPAPLDARRMYEWNEQQCQSRSRRDATCRAYLDRVQTSCRKG